MHSTELDHVLCPKSELSTQQLQRMSLLTRRSFLTLAGRGSLALGLVPLLDQSGRAQRKDIFSLVNIPGASKWLATREWQDLILAGLGSYAVAGITLHNLQQMVNTYDFENLRDLSPEGKRLYNYYRWAGTRTGWRESDDAQALWKKVPAPIRAGGPAKLIEFHKGKNWSHIIAASNGGTDLASNGIWWSASKNQSLGNQNMTWRHILHARSVLVLEGVLAALAGSIRPMLAGSMATVVFVGVLTILELGLRYYVGDISRLELAQGVIGTVVAAGAGSFILLGLIMGLALAFPVIVVPILKIVTIPLSVVGVVFLFNQLTDLGVDWWQALDEQGHLPEFLASLRIVEEVVGTLSLWRKRRSQVFATDALARIANWVPDMNLGLRIPQFDFARYFPGWDWNIPGTKFAIANLDAVNSTVTSFGDRALQALPDWRGSIPNWKVDLDTGKLVPDKDFAARLPTFGLHIGDYLSDLGLPRLDSLSAPIPDLRKGARSAQDALVSASSYLTAKGALLQTNASR